MTPEVNKEQSTMASTKTKIGFIGCGNISDVYVRVAQSFESLEVLACADRHIERATALAARYGLPRACTPDALLADPEIQIVVNLTPPTAHAEIALAALEAGKSIYNEKPLAIGREEARRLLELAEQKGLYVGCAPDTFLGAGLQTCRKLIDEGAIGEPVGASAFMLSRGPEAWHPNPDFFYQPGAGPLFDVGPYYLTALVALLGPVRRVSGATRISFPERTVGSGPRQGAQITVRTPTHITGLLDFTNGAVGTITTSFDVWKSDLPYIEIYGSEGTLNTPDPNTFGGPLRLWRAKTQAWEAVPLLPGYAENTRSLGVADMARAIQTGRPVRASGRLAYHVLDLMHAIHESSAAGRHVDIASTCERPAPLPPGGSPE
jgi:predicted dehydrogenase